MLRKNKSRKARRLAHGHLFLRDIGDQTQDPIMLAKCFTPNYSPGSSQSILPLQAKEVYWEQESRDVRFLQSARSVKEWSGKWGKRGLGDGGGKHTVGVGMHSPLGSLLEKGKSAPSQRRSRSEGSLNSSMFLHHHPAQVLRQADGQWVQKEPVSTTYSPSQLSMQILEIQCFGTPLSMKRLSKAQSLHVREPNLNRPRPGLKGLVQELVAQWSSAYLVYMKPYV